MPKIKKKWLFTAMFVMLLVMLVSKDMSHVIYMYRSVRYIYYSNPEPVNCDTDKPCEYPEQVDLRIILMTFQRPSSLKVILDELDELDLDGDVTSMEIWIDRDKNGSVHLETVRVAEAFVWSRGQKRVHIQDQHVGIYGQWIDTWRPAPDSDELALFLEDDISVSPYAWKWIKNAHKHYSSDESCYGYTLQSMGVINATDAKKILPFNRPNKDTAFMYQLLGSWGFVPKSSYWIAFQDWFHHVRDKATFHPYVNGLVMTKWYKSFEKKKTADSMWTMWFIFYTDMKRTYCVYNNLNHIYNSTSYSLAVHRKEKGLHYNGKVAKTIDSKKLLLKTWSSDYVKFPQHIKKYTLRGMIKS